MYHCRLQQTSLDKRPSQMLSLQKEIHLRTSVHPPRYSLTYFSVLSRHAGPKLLNHPSKVMSANPFTPISALQFHPCTTRESLVSGRTKVQCKRTIGWILGCSENFDENLSSTRMRYLHRLDRDLAQTSFDDGFHERRSHGVYERSAEC